MGIAPSGRAKQFLEIQELCVSYCSGTEKTRALDAIHLEMGAGEVVGVLGESGCGKSTLAHSIPGLLPKNGKLNGGEILFRGRNLLSLSEDQLRAVRGREISLIPQDPALSLNPVIATGTQISEVLRAHLPLTARQCRARVIELLHEVGFDQPEEIYRAYPHQLSGGQRQRVVIAQAIACTPRLIIADEPTSKLDASLRAEIVALLSKIRLQHDTAVLFITHEPALLPGFADRIAVLYAGKVVEIGACDQLLRNPLHPYTEALLRLARPGAPAISRKHLPTIEGEVPDLTVNAGGCIFEPRCAARMRRCAQEIPREFVPETARSVSCFKYGE